MQITLLKKKDCIINKKNSLLKVRISCLRLVLDFKNGINRLNIKKKKPEYEQIQCSRLGHGSYSYHGTRENLVTPSPNFSVKLEFCRIIYH